MQTAGCWHLRSFQLCHIQQACQSSQTCQSAPPSAVRAHTRQDFPLWKLELECFQADVHSALMTHAWHGMAWSGSAATSGIGLKITLAHGSREGLALSVPLITDHMTAAHWPLTSVKPAARLALRRSCSSRAWRASAASCAFCRMACGVVPNTHVHGPSFGEENTCSCTTEPGCPTA